MKNNKNVEEVVNKVIAKILGLKEEGVRDDISPDNTSNWDSFNGLMILAEIEKETGLSFNMKDVLRVKTVGDIKEVINKYLKDED